MKECQTKSSPVSPESSVHISFASDPQLSTLGGSWGANCPQQTQGSPRIAECLPGSRYPLCSDSAGHTVGDSSLVPSTSSLDPIGKSLGNLQDGISSTPVQGSQGGRCHVVWPPSCGSSSHNPFLPFLTTPSCPWILLKFLTPPLATSQLVWLYPWYLPLLLPLNYISQSLPLPVFPPSLA